MTTKNKARLFPKRARAAIARQVKKAHRRAVRRMYKFIIDGARIPSSCLIEAKEHPREAIYMMF